MAWCRSTPKIVSFCQEIYGYDDNNSCMIMDLPHFFKTLSCAVCLLIKQTLYGIIVHSNRYMVEFISSALPIISATDPPVTLSHHVPVSLSHGLKQGIIEKMGTSPCVFFYCYPTLSSNLR